MQGLLLNSRVAVAQSDPYGRGPGVTAILTAQEVEKSFGEHRVLRGVSFAVQEGDRIALVGLNGSGKSTLMRLLVGPQPGDEQLADDKREADSPKFEDVKDRVVQSLQQKAVQAHVTALMGKAKIEQ